MDGDQPPRDLTVEALASPTRRALLHMLAAEGGETSRAAIARDLRGEAATGPAVDAHGRPLEAALHHVHLPKLDAAGLIEYDPAAGTVYPGTPSTTATALLAILSGEEISA